MMNISTKDTSSEFNELQTELRGSFGDVISDDAGRQVGFLRPDKRSRTFSRLRQRVGILGIPIDNLTLDETVSILDRYIQERQFNQIATANADFLLRAVHDGELREILQRCSMVLADGMPIVWASRLLRNPLRERVAGADLVPVIAELANRKSYGIYLLGAEESRSVAAATWIRDTHPNARVVGRYSPPLSSIEDMDNEYILRDIAAAAPDILLVAFGNPKQEKWLHIHRNRLSVPVCIGVGASLDFLSGLHRRAPYWMQSSGLEWLHRLYREPSRLAPRYLSNAAGILRYFSQQLVTVSTQRKANQSNSPTQYWVGDTSVITVPGNFSAHFVTDFESLIYRTSTLDCSLVIDLSHTQYLGADALGALISLSKRMGRARRALWLVGVPPRIRRVLRASLIEDSFQSTPDLSEALRRIDRQLSAHAC